SGNTTRPASISQGNERGPAFVPFREQEVLRATSIWVFRDPGRERGAGRDPARAGEPGGLRRLPPELSDLRKRRNRLQRAVDAGRIQRFRVRLRAGRGLAVLRQAASQRWQRL